MSVDERKRDKQGRYAPEGKKSPTPVETWKTPLAPVEAPAEEKPDVDSLYEKFKNMSEYEPEVYDDLKNYGIDLYDTPKQVDNDTATEVLEMIEEARSNYRNSRHRPGSRDYDPGNCEGLLDDAFSLLGYDSNESYKRGTQLLSDVSWEPEYYFDDKLYR